MIYVVLAAFTLYFLFMLLLIGGWYRAIALQPTPMSESGVVPRISVVVAFRNEERNLRALVGSLTDQDCQEFEVILVDDHSQDDGPAIVEKLISGKANYRLLTNSGEGKKQAVTTGVRAASGDLILTTDADCTVPNSWVSTVQKTFAKEEVRFAFGPVRIAETSGNLQPIEFMSVFAAGAGMFGLGFPIYCNGANMAFRKSDFLAVGGYTGNEHIPSGDDEFLLKKIRSRFSQGIRFMATADAIVETEGQPSLYAFIQQRIRWAGKWRASPGWISKSLAIFMFSFQIMWLISWWLMFSGLFVKPLTFVIFGKVIFDFIVIFNVAVFLRQRVKLFPFLLIQTLYPFYLLLIGIMANFGRYSWKGRSVRPKAPAGR